MSKHNREEIKRIEKDIATFNILLRGQRTYVSQKELDHAYRTAIDYLNRAKAELARGETPETKQIKTEDSSETFDKLSVGDKFYCCGKVFVKIRDFGSVKQGICNAIKLENGHHITFGPYAPVKFICSDVSLANKILSKEDDGK